MVGGEHRITLTGALLRLWTGEGAFAAEFTSWVKANGGVLIFSGGNVKATAEDAETGFVTGADRQHLFAKANKTLSYAWDTLVDHPKAKPNAPEGTSWGLVMYQPRYGILERVQVLGPKGGKQGSFNLGWHFLVPQGKPVLWQVATTGRPEGAFSTHANYLWMWGLAHTAIVPCDLDSLGRAIHTNEVFAKIVAGMFNEMLTKLSPADPAMAARAFGGTPALGEPQVFEQQLVEFQAAITQRNADALEQVKAQVMALESDLAVSKARLKKQEETTTTNLEESIQTMLAKGLVSEVRKDKRGLWFLFDDIHTVVSPELAARGGDKAEPGIYLVDPAVVLVPWGARGSAWVCGAPNGDAHRHHHVSVNGAWQPVCFGHGGLAPEGFSNKSWFNHLWDADIVKWAETIHQFLGRTSYESGLDYRPIWTCATLIKPLLPKPKLTVTKLPTPTLHVKRLKMGTAPIATPVVVDDADDIDNDEEEEVA